MHLSLLKNAIISAVIVEGEDHEREQEVHADGLGDFKEAVGGFATRDDFVEQEEDMTAVERWDGEDVHKGEHERDEGGELPEALPVPRLGEEVSYRAKRTDTACSFFGEKVFQIAHITHEDITTMNNACWNAL